MDNKLSILILQCVQYGIVCLSSISLAVASYHVVPKFYDFRSINHTTTIEEDRNNKYAIVSSSSVSLLISTIVLAGTSAMCILIRLVRYKVNQGSSSSSSSNSMTNNNSGSSSGGRYLREYDVVLLCAAILLCAIVTPEYVDMYLFASVTYLPLIVYDEHRDYTSFKWVPCATTILIFIWYCIQIGADTTSYAIAVLYSVGVVGLWIRMLLVSPTLSSLNVLSSAVSHLGSKNSLLDNSANLPKSPPFSPLVPPGVPSLLLSPTNRVCVMNFDQNIQTDPTVDIPMLDNFTTSSEKVVYVCSNCDAVHHGNVHSASPPATVPQRRSSKELSAIVTPDPRPSVVMVDAEVMTDVMPSPVEVSQYNSIIWQDMGNTVLSNHSNNDNTPTNPLGSPHSPNHAVSSNNSDGPNSARGRTTTVLVSPESESEHSDSSAAFTVSTDSTSKPLKRRHSRVRATDIAVEKESVAKKAEKTANWKMGALLGRGAFGEVHLGFNHDDGILMAVKTVDFDPADPNLKSKIEELQNEIQILKSLNHNNIVRYHFVEKEDTKIHICMEYVAGGSIRDVLRNFGPLKEEVVVDYTHQLLFIMEYLRRKGIVHRDIKGANVLITTEGNVKLSDFGSASYNTNLQGGLRGTPSWMAPEVLQGQMCSAASDMWALGCTVMEMLTAEPPWAHISRSQSEVMCYVVDDTREIVLPAGLSTESSEFLLQVLRRNPAERLTPDELLMHHFFWSEEDLAYEIDNNDHVVAPTYVVEEKNPHLNTYAFPVEQTESQPVKEPSRVQSPASPRAGRISSTTSPILSPRSTRRAVGGAKWGTALTVDASGVQQQGSLVPVGSGAGYPPPQTPLNSAQKGSISSGTPIAEIHAKRLSSAHEEALMAYFSPRRWEVRQGSILSARKSSGHEGGPLSTRQRGSKEGAHPWARRKSSDKDKNPLSPPLVPDLSAPPNFEEHKL